MKSLSPRGVGFASANVPNAGVAAPPPSRHRSARNRSGRLLAAVTAAIIAIGSFLAVTSAPAAADQQGVIDQARFRAQLALLRPDCRQYLTGPDFGPPDGRDPQQLVGGVEIVAGPVPAGQPAGAIASSPIAAGVRGTITVHPNFFAADPGLPVSPAAAFAPSADQQRTIAILHELGHLTGREGDHNRDLPRQFDYNATILNLCLLGPPLEITAFSCDMDGPDYYGHFSCYLSWTGGTDPDQVQISSNTNMARRTNHYDENYVTLQGTCRGVNNPYVSVTVFDSGGRRADADQYAFC